MAKPPSSKPVKAATRRRSPVMFIVIGVVVVLGVIAVVVSRSGSKTKTDVSVKETRPVTVSGTPLPEFQATANDPAVGLAAPGLAGQTFAGEPVTISNDGNAKLLMFVAHWCPHCQKEVPLITSYLKGNQPPAGLQLYAVSTSVNASAPNYPPSAWLQRESWPVTTMADDAQQSAATAYGLTSFPYFVAVGKDGKVVARASGELTTDQFAALMHAAVSGTSTGI